MSTNRIKVTKPIVPVPSSREEAERIVREIATAKITERALKAEMDAELIAVRKRYEARLAQTDELIQPRVEAIRDWADAHQDDFGGKKSLEMTHGIIGWRVTPPALKPLKGFTWGAVLNRLKDLGKFDFIRVKEEPNKEALLAVRLTENLKQYYLGAVQEDEFYVEPKMSEVTNKV